MSKRPALVALLVTLAASAAMAALPGARYETRMVYDSSIQRIVLFGGLTALDAGTAKAYDLGDTWEWNGQKWTERFTPVAPSARSSYSMLYDSNRSRVLFFGGKNGTTYLNDTWQYQNGAWSQIATPNSPPGRVLAGAAFDPLRDRMIIYGGTGLDAAQKAFPYRDTWEFDGTTWRQVADAGPDVAKPALFYDKARAQTFMLATDTAFTTHMYKFEPGSNSWTEMKPSLLPPCVNEGMVTYDTTRNVAVYTGGTCASSTSLDETYEWDGTTWTKVTLNSNDGRAFGGAIAYDEAHQQTITYGGYTSLNGARYQTYIYSGSGWLSTGDTQPVPRSLAVFASDPDTGTVWLYGGVSSGSALSDFWRYQNGHFDSVVGDGQPASCTHPLGTYDVDRKLLVFYCGGIGTTYEYNPAKNAWAALTPKHAPIQRSFASMVYDQNLKKSVLFGGFDASNVFRDDTWLWDGTDWTEAKKDPPPSRELHSMWYDPILKKTVIFGGLGRLTSQDRLTRYDDMWQFDGTAWTELKPATLPTTRYGARVAVDPRNGHTFLFGGLVVTGTDPTQVQAYSNETWEWDGTTWKQVATDGNPPARENTALAFDPVRKEMVMFAGYGGYYLSDLWSLTNGTNWRPWADTTLRRRAAGR